MARHNLLLYPLHTEMAVLKMLGDRLENSGWCSALVAAEIASSIKAQSFLHALHVSRTRSAHQVCKVFLSSFGIWH